MIHIAKKVVSTWIDNSKLRKEIYDFNQAAKSVFYGYKYIDGIAIPIDINAIRNPTLFSNAFFVRPDETQWEFINNCAVDPESLNTALKTKSYTHEYLNGVHYLHREGEDKKAWCRVGNRLTDDDLIESLANHKGLKNFKTLDSTDPVGTYKLSSEMREKIIGYQMFDDIIANDGGINVNLLIGKEIFPMIKRTEDISITTYRHETKCAEGIYTILIRSVLPTWTFYSIHAILIY